MTRQNGLTHETWCSGVTMVCGISKEVTPNVYSVKTN